MPRTSLIVGAILALLAALTLCPPHTAAQQPSSQPQAEGSQLQAEVFKEKWLRFRDKPFPWHVRLLADAVFWMKE